jgi:hypothetical protein
LSPSIIWPGCPKAPQTVASDSAESTQAKFFNAKTSPGGNRERSLGWK